MMDTPLEEDLLLAAVGPEIRSDLNPSVVYRIGRRVGEGGMSVAYLALRIAPEGQCPVVLKIMRMQCVSQYGETAMLVAKKEAVALGRLNERVPATPFVVRLVDVGNAPARDGDVRAMLPWIALEYIHGGVEGTTLTERVAYSVQATGSAFDPARAAHAITCLAKGLTAVHEVGVIHRDLKPDNVLCCGFGDEEIFKVADFGVARPTGITGTFGGMPIGTPGFAAPELIVSDSSLITSRSDLFSLAAVIFFLLTGEEYFPARTITDALLGYQAGTRRSLLDTAWLCPELRQREAVCRALDLSLARATSLEPKDRPADAESLAASLLPWLRTDSRRLRSGPRRLERLASHEERKLPGWQWITRQFPGSDHVILSVAWDGDGRCLAATTRGLAFWTGTAWREAPLHGLPHPESIRFVRRIAAGKWLIGCDPATFATYTEEGVREVIELADASLRVRLFSGDFDDLAVMVATDPQGATRLHTLVGRRWVRPCEVPGAAAVTSIARVGDARWLIAGRTVRGAALAALFSPLDFELTPLATPDVRAFLSAAGHPDTELGVVTGVEGAVVMHQGDHAWTEWIAGKPDLAAVVVDAAGACWAGAAGRIWHRPKGDPGASHWDCVWEQSGWTAPIVSMFADVGMVIGMTADGGMIEGRTIELELGTLLGMPSTDPGQAPVVSRRRP